MGIPKDSDNTSGAGLKDFSFEALIFMDYLNFSGISSISHNHTGSERRLLPPMEQLPEPRPIQQQRNRRRRRSQSGAAVLEKKSVFTRAYEGARVARPNSAEVLMDE